ncbi:MAG TPA: IclR family transcriptional regulator [Ktedonobacterales bacterium]|nr:IclR family transcriptional regulator [Ktedonobacterales bacterium]
MDYHVPSVALAAQALKLLSRHKYKCCSLKVIAEKLEASPTTCLRVLRTLEHEGFVRFDQATKMYSLGPYLIPLGNRAAELNDAITRASHEIKRIAALTGLTTGLLQRWDDRLVYIASAEPPAENVRLSISVGQATPLASGAHGRCFLAFDDEAEWQRFIAAGLRPITQATITDPNHFVKALREVRRNGYAVSHGEFNPGFSAVDVPIFGKTGRVELVISCMCVTAQLDDERLAAVVKLLRATARKLSEWSGYPEQWSADMAFADLPDRPSEVVV